MNIQDLAFRMEERLDDFYTSGDPAVLREAEAEKLAHRLYYAIDWLAPYTGTDAARAFNVALLLATFHFQRFQYGGTREDAKRAVFLYRLVCLTAPHHVPETVLSSFREHSDEVNDTPSESRLAGYNAQGVNLLKEAEANGDRQLLDDAVEWCLLAARANPRQDVLWAEALVTLGNVFTRRYEYTGDEKDLDRAFHVTVKAVEVIPEDDPCRLKASSGFGHIAIRMFQRSGELHMLDLAVNALREAAYGAPADFEHRAALLTNLSSALSERYRHTGLADAAAEALDARAEAVRITPRGHPDLPSRLVNLAGALASRAGHAAVGDDQHDAAVTLLREALPFVPDGHPDRPGCLHLLGGVLRARFTQKGDPRDLADAVDASRSAVQSATASGYLRPDLLRGLAEALSTHAGHFAEPGVLTEAVTALQEADGLLSDDHPDRTETLTALGFVLRDRFKAAGNTADLDQAVAALRAASAVPTAPAQARALAAVGAGEIAADAEDFTGATASYALALEQLELTAWRGLERPDRERLIAKFPSLVADAAACAVRAGKVERAVELVEQGRGILLAQALETRTDHRDLRAQAPELADRLSEILDGLERLSDSPSGLAARETEERRRAHERRAALARRREELLAEIRALPGHDRFLRPPSFTTLRAAAARGPVVLLTASQYGCWALILTGADVRVVPLAVDVRQLADQAVAFLHALGGEPSPLKARNTVLDSLAWLWKKVTEPVLDALGCSEPVGPGGEWPRLWWCPTGLFTLFPLHAVGNHGAADGGTDTTLDRVISSYTPTLRVLLHTREHPGPPAGEDTRGLIVSLPSTPGRPDLPAAGNEARALHQRYPNAQLLTGPAATTPAVTEALTHCSWAHFACHGSQDITQPSRGALMLHDGPLMLWDIANLRLPHAELAFLSACETSRGGVVLADEAITFAAAVQLAGFRHVVGTLWSIDDAQAPIVADRVYENLSRQDTLDPAAALHAAVRAMRAERPQAVLNWAPYVHVGP
ncbi:CHAT domain-containing protein [Streptomyces sp. NPDC020792]|uniref:CHAT domain-containing protein n=1 Tax=Streptomyces sp. NPDC020792 TaxID=3365089 RepID=UPI0037BBA078